MKPFALALAFSLAFCPSLATRLTAEEARQPFFKPMTGHVMAPREALDLCGKWQASPAPQDSASPSSNWIPVDVPAQHSKLFNKANGAVWFKRSFSLPSLSAQSRYMLCFERVTDSCEVFVNGKRVGSSDDGHFPFRIDASDALKEGENELLVKVLSPYAANAKGNRPIGWDWFYGQFTGIPYPVHLERTGELRIENVHVMTRLFPSPSLEAEVELFNAGRSTKKARVVARSGASFECESQEFSLEPGQSLCVRLQAPWLSPKLWQPHDPQLQNLDVSVLAGPETLDAFRQRFGFREISVSGPDMFLNGVKLLNRRSSMIPYWNLTDEATLRSNIAILRERGFNGWRLHGGAATPRIAEIADEEGWLLAPETAINTPRAHEVSEAFWPAAAKHVEAMVKAFRNHPSVAYWDISNEFASYYMKGSVEEKAAVDAKVLSFGRLAERLDPTRTWTCDGDGELGGVGKHGPAPTLNFHYPWQVWKNSNMIPTSAYWLDEGLCPWPGIVWDKTKPIMIGEDLHPPYSLKIPEGLCQWAGDAACDPSQGVYKAWFDAIRMLAPGYYRAGVSVWNIWATAETSKDNPLYALGQPVPDFLIASRSIPPSVSSGSRIEAPLDLYNVTFKSRVGLLKASLLLDGAAVGFKSLTLDVPAGRLSQASFSFDAPALQSFKELSLECSLNDASTGESLASASWRVAAFPAFPIAAPAGCALVSSSPCFGSVSFPAGRFQDLSSALAAKPSSLVAVGLSLDSKDALALRSFVSYGGKALLVESKPSASLPLRVDANSKAAFAFVRSPNDPAAKGLGEAALRLWRPSGLVASAPFAKPKEGDAEIILDCGYALGSTPLARVRCGGGFYILCQLELASSFSQEPAAAHVLQALLKSLNAPLPSRGGRVSLEAASAGRLAEAFKKAGVQVASSGQEKAALLVFDGRAKLSASQLELIRSRAASGLDSFVDGLCPESAEALSSLLGHELKLSKSEARQIRRSGDSPLSDGVSDMDLCWFAPEQFSDMVSARMNGRPFAPKGDPMLDGEISCQAPGSLSPFSPSGLLKIPFLKGSLLVSSVRWDAFASKTPQKSRAYIAGVLRNSGCLTCGGDVPLRVYLPADISKSMNRGFWGRLEQPVPAWFGDPRDDMRYFPVNVTGNDPVLNMPQPAERFPSSSLIFAGVDFKLVDPDSNGGRSCLVLADGESCQLPVSGEAVSLWMLGALGSMKPAGEGVCSVRISYEDGSFAEHELKAGAELNGYQYPTDASAGVCAWIGPNTSRKDVVVWAWSVANPHPERKISSVFLTAKGAPLALAALSLEQRR